MGLVADASVFFSFPLSKLILILFAKYCHYLIYAVSSYKWDRFFLGHDLMVLGAREKFLHTLH
jgi:hypothetical protein